MLTVNATPNDPCMPAINPSTHAAAGKYTKVSNIIAFFNSQANTAKMPRFNMLHGCFKITPNTSGGVIVECKNCTKFGVSSRIFLFRNYDSFWIHTLTLCCFLIFLYFQTRKWKSFNATFARGHALQFPGVAIEVLTPVSFRIVRLEDLRRNDHLNSTYQLNLGQQTIVINLQVTFSQRCYKIHKEIQADILDLHGYGTYGRAFQALHPHQG
jgi:hypothetical protein